MERERDSGTESKASPSKVILAETLLRQADLRSEATRKDGDKLYEDFASLTSLNAAISSVTIDSRDEQLLSKPSIT